MLKNIFILNILFLSLCITAQVKRDTVNLYFLGGQSNMQGFGYNKDLPKNLNKTFKNVWIFQGYAPYDSILNGGLGKWEKLKPGFGIGFNTDGSINTLSDRFGCELSLAEKLSEEYPDRKIAFIKYARGGSMLDSLAKDYGGGYWEPDFKRGNGKNQYYHMLTTLRNALSNHDIDRDGIEDVLLPKGIFWMQGENDAVTSEEVSLRYYDNLKKLMFLIRAALHNPDLPIVIGKLSDKNYLNSKIEKIYPYGELVQYGQEKFAKEDENVAIMRNTLSYEYADNWHYKSEAYIDMGKKFAELITLLCKKE